MLMKRFPGEKIELLGIKEGKIQREVSGSCQYKLGSVFVNLDECICETLQASLLCSTTLCTSILHPVSPMLI